jgi:hypothetical protein
MSVGEGRVGIEKAGMAGAKDVVSTGRRVEDVTDPRTVLACAM